MSQAAVYRVSLAYLILNSFEMTIDGQISERGTHSNEFDFMLSMFLQTPVGNDGLGRDGLHYKTAEPSSISSKYVAENSE
ncbi:hypothetical protein NBRC116583_19820 [Arenicella sp. 4NH20-0111]